MKNSISNFINLVKRTRRNDKFFIGNITDDWFRSHFIYAPDVIHQWMIKWSKKTNLSILDFGCGDGIMSLGMRLRYPIDSLCGVDLHDSNRFLADTAMKQIDLQQLPSNFWFLTIDPNKTLFETTTKKFDFAYSWSVFEHIEAEFLPKILGEIREVLNNQGIFFIQIEPLYYSPFGSHLGGVVKEPWAHLLLSEEDLRKKIFGFDLNSLDAEFKNKTFEVCSNEDFKKYLMREYKTLNKLTCNELVKLCEEAGFSVIECWKNQVDIEPPIQLLDKYEEEDLVTSEIRLLLR